MSLRAHFSFKFHFKIDFLNLIQKMNKNTKIGGPPTSAFGSEAACVSRFNALKQKSVAI